MRKYLLLLILVTAALSLAAPASRAQDAMAKWKPSVGDIFVYFQKFTTIDYWHGSPSLTRSTSDTLTMEILNIDTNYDAGHQHVVTVRESFSNHKKSFKALYYFHSGLNSSSTHSFAIDAGDTLCTNCNISYDFSIATDRQVTYQSDTLIVYSFRHDSTVMKGSASGQITYGAQYSPTFKWFYSDSASDDEPPPDFTYTGTYNSSKLISANTKKSGVEQQPSKGYAAMSIYQSANLLTVIWHAAGIRPFAISLLDPLARVIRSWQIPEEAGKRRITLNVADVPSGVYFLELEASGVSEVRKVAIVR